MNLGTEYSLLPNFSSLTYDVGWTLGSRQAGGFSDPGYTVVYDIEFFLAPRPFYGIGLQKRILCSWRRFRLLTCIIFLQHGPYHGGPRRAMAGASDLSFCSFLVSFRTERAFWSLLSLDNPFKS